MGVAEHLDLDVPRGVDRLLEVERVVAERRLRLGGRGRERVLELERVVHEPHALAAAARGRLQQHRVAELERRLARVRDRRAAVGARHERHARGAHLLLRHAPCRPCAPSPRRPARRRRGRSPRTRARRRGSRTGSPYPGWTASQPVVVGGARRSTGSAGSSRRRAAARSGPPGRRGARGARSRPRSSRRRPPRSRARAARGSRARRSRPGSRPAPARTRLQRVQRLAGDRLELEQELAVLDRLRVLDVDRADDALVSALTSFISFIASRMQSVCPAATVSPISTNGGEPGCGAR